MGNNKDILFTERRALVAPREHHQLKTPLNKRCFYVVDPYRLFTNSFERITKVGPAMGVFTYQMRELMERPLVPDKVTVKL